jgi:hypothetical protein
VAATLVKSRVSEAQIVETIRALLDGRKTGQPAKAADEGSEVV